MAARYGDEATDALSALLDSQLSGELRSVSLDLLGAELAALTALAPRLPPKTT